MIEGKLKEDFEKWVVDKKFKLATKIKSNYIKKDDIVKVIPHSVFDESFYKLPLSMQFGVYQDFADSINYNVFTNKYKLQETFHFQADYSGGTFPNRNDARIHSIKEFNNWYNNKFK